MPEIDLSQLRKEIDVIDAEIHALIVRRAHISESIRGVKSDDEPKLRPGREANILRALLARAGYWPRGRGGASARRRF